VQDVHGDVRVVGNRVQTVVGRVQDVRVDVQDVGDKVQDVDDRVQDIDDKTSRPGQLFAISLNLTVIPRAERASLGTSSETIF
jgi:hypothetical protein